MALSWCGRLTWSGGGTVSYSGSGVNSLTLQSSKTTCIQVTAVEQSSGTLLIVMYKKGQYAAKNLAAIHECVLMLRNGTSTLSWVCGVHGAHCRREQCVY